MTTRKILLFSILLFIFTAGYGQEAVNNYQGEPDIIGYVMEKRESEILVISPEKKETAGEEYSYPYPAVWVSNTKKDAKIGEQVRVWFKNWGGDSYPGKSAAGKLEVLSTLVPDGENLTQFEALNKALTKNDFGAEFLAVDSISFDGN